MAMAGLAGCRKPVEKIIPYVVPPEEIIPGVPLFYATTMPFGDTAYGLLVETHEGRPTKIEGNELHPSTRGTSNSFIQASMLGLYDPDRSQRVLSGGAESKWQDFVTYWRSLHSRFAANQGTGLAVLSEAFSSPTLKRLADEFSVKFLNSKWVTYEPVSDENIYDGIRIATGNAYRPLYAYDKAEVILSLDSDFVFGESESMTAAMGFADGRRITSERDSMNRLYVVESVFSLTGSLADHRLRLQSSQIAAFAAALIVELNSQGLAIPIVDHLGEYREHRFDRQWLKTVAADLLRARGKCLVVAGRRQPAIVQALTYVINNALGNIGSIVSYCELTDARISARAELADLVKLMRDGNVDTLVIIGGNPAYNAPSDLDFASALGRVKNSIQLSHYADETSRSMKWHIPQAHYLESWGDTRSADGTASIIQPMIEPLFGGHSSVEMLQLMVDGRDLRGYEIVRESWSKLLSGNFEKQWRRVLHDGRLEGSSLTTITTALNNDTLTAGLKNAPIGKGGIGNEDLELVFQASPAVYDGRFANNGWLQEMPHPVTKITWDNVATISPATAARLRLQNGDMVRLTLQGRSLELPIWVLPGQADNSIGVDLGYGRRAAGRVGDGVGFDTYSLRPLDAPDIALGLSLVKTGSTYSISCAQDHGSMEGRPLVREATLDEYRRKPEFASEMVEHPPLVSLFEDRKYDQGYQWGMAVDLNACIGCNACTIACQSENNIPIVGKRQVANGREMNWIRIDRYFVGKPEEAEMVHQPVTCQHCEKAPCEQVCPVAATVHDREGLNVMVYNRCIGTRYCSNNCPYKVRRFNFFNYTVDTPEIVKMAMNPDVTVRSRGVMEKCSFCVQRINFARSKAKQDERDIRDGEIITACQQACPTRAIVFGNVNDPESKVSKIKRQNRNYELLAELNTAPRLSYQARIRNPHPELDRS